MANQDRDPVHPSVGVTIDVSAPNRGDGICIHTTIEGTEEISAEEAVRMATEHAIRQATAAIVASRETD
jgi:hypothetical protein